MRGKVVDPLKDNRWDQFVTAHDYGSIYHLSAWKKVIEQTYKYSPLYYVFEDQQGNIRGAMPFFLIRSWLTGARMVSLPFSDTCDPLLDTEADAETMVDCLKRELEDRGASYFQIRSFKNGKILEDLNLQKDSYYESFVLRLSMDPLEIQKDFTKSARKAIRKAKKSGVNVRVSTAEEDLERFYYLNLRTRKRLGLPSQPYRLFQNIWKYMAPKKLAFLLIAECNGKIIAAGVFFSFKNIMYWKYTGSDVKFLNRRPIDALVWSGIELACKGGYKFFDFGRTSPDNQGLIRFKRKWGMKEIVIPYYYYPKIKGITSIEEKSIRYRLMTGIWRRVPMPLAKIAGGTLYKHLG